ncbi:hypothetical protein ACB098_12G078500 [Castanea mollissima]
MMSSSNKINKTIYLHVLFGLFVSVINLMQDSKGHPEENLSKFNPIHADHLPRSSFERAAQLPSNVARSVQDNFITLAIKFQHFYISRFLQFRYLPLLQPAPSAISMLFWVAFTQSISSMSDDSL